MTKPIIAAVNGAAAGVGLAVACLPISGSWQPMPPSTSRRFSGAEAASLGLANAALDPDEVLSHAQHYGAELVRLNSRASLRETKRLIYGDLHRSVAEAAGKAHH